MTEPFVISAELRPLKPWQQTVTCAVFARTGKGKVKVELRGGTKFAVDRFRLYEPRVPGRTPARIGERDLDKLPWEGTGPDPLERSARGSGSTASSKGALV